MSDDIGRTFRVTFEMTASRKNVDWFGAPTPEWIEEMVAGPGSVWRMESVQVDEVRE